MTFNVQNLSLCSYSTNDSAPEVYTYTSGEDNLASIIGNNNYFSTVANVFSANDLIFVTGMNDGGADNQAWCSVVSSSVADNTVVIKQLNAKSSFTWFSPTIAEGNVQMIANAGYLFLEAPTGSYTVPQITLTLPTTMDAGSTISIFNYTGMTIKIKQNANQTMIFGFNPATSAIVQTTVGVNGYLMAFSNMSSFDLFSVDGHEQFLIRNSEGTAPDYF